MHRLAIIIPAYNECDQLQAVLSRLPKRLEGVEAVQAVVINDGSCDNTARVAASAGAKVISHPINRGQGAALQTGFEYAINKGFDLVVTFDADGQHDASEIADLIQPILDGRADVALGSRFLSRQPENISASRKLTLKLGVAFTRVLSQISITDTHNGFRALGPAALAKIHIKQDKMEHASEILEQISAHRLRYCEVPVTIRYSEYSKAKGQRNSNALRIAFKMVAYKFML